MPAHKTPLYAEHGSKKKKTRITKPSNIQKGKLYGTSI